jgi:hypothetical protein
MVVIHRVVCRSAGHHACERVDRIVAEYHRAPVLCVTQVLRHRLTDDRGDADAAPFSLIAQLFVTLGREPKVGGYVPRHNSDTISRYRHSIKPCHIAWK